MGGAPWRDRTTLSFSGAGKSLGRRDVEPCGQACADWLGDERGRGEGPLSSSVHRNLGCSHTASSQVLSWQHIASQCSVQKRPLWNRVCPVGTCPAPTLVTVPACTQPAVAGPLSLAATVLGYTSGFQVTGAIRLEGWNTSRATGQVLPTDYGRHREH